MLYISRHILAAENFAKAVPKSSLAKILQFVYINFKISFSCLHKCMAY